MNVPLMMCVVFLLLGALAVCSHMEYRAQEKHLRRNERQSRDRHKEHEWARAFPPQERGFTRTKNKLMAAYVVVAFIVAISPILGLLFYVFINKP